MFKIDISLGSESEGGNLTKKCSICGSIKENMEFYSQEKRSKKKGLYTYYHPECKECSKTRSLKWTDDNRVKANEFWRNYNKGQERKEKLKEHKKKYVENGGYTKWLENNKEKSKEYNNYKLMHGTHDITETEWKKCKDFFGNSCAYCGLKEEDHYRKIKGRLVKNNLNKEHVVHDGSNQIDNCVPSCHNCNSQKWIFDLEDWFTDINPNYTYERLERIYEWMKNNAKIID